MLDSFSFMLWLNVKKIILQRNDVQLPTMCEMSVPYPRKSIRIKLLKGILCAELLIFLCRDLLLTIGAIFTIHKESVT